MEKIPFLTKEQAEEICKTYPTPFHIYDEKGIRENARLVQKAFAWNKGYREYFAVKATPNPYILKILKEEGCGVDCSSLTELMMSDACGFSGSDIMFSSNVTPAEDYKLAYKLGAYINLDDLTHIDYLDQLTGIPETICCRFNAGGNFTISTFVMDKPQDAKYGFTREQMFEGFRKLMAKGAKHFGIHAFLASNTVTNDYYPTLARQMFQLAVDLKNETGADITFINLSGGVGVAYRPDQTPNDILAIVRAFTRSSMRSWFRTAWAMWHCLRRWDASCLLPTAHLCPACSTRSTSTRNMSASMRVPPISCARLCTGHTTTSPCLARSMSR